MASNSNSGAAPAYSQPSSGEAQSNTPSTTTPSTDQSAASRSTTTTTDQNAGASNQTGTAGANTAGEPAANKSSQGTLPKTGSFLPLLGLLGFSSAGLGWLLRK